jgi:hypothetical protein
MEVASVEAEKFENPSSICIFIKQKAKALWTKLTYFFLLKVVE